MTNRPSAAAPILIMTHGPGAKAAIPPANGRCRMVRPAHLGFAAGERLTQADARDLLIGRWP